MSGSRVRYSINLDEDFELYGIDPNENLDDWSFLDQKPEPIPEKTEEEKRLFEQLLMPTITEDDVNRDIHARLKNLINETDQLIENNENDPLIRDKKAEIEKQENERLNTPEIQQQRANTPEMQQANRVKSIISSLLKSTEKAEDIAEFIEKVTQSDKIDPNTIEVPDSALSVPAARLLPQIKRHEKELEKEKNISENEEEEDKEEQNNKENNENNVNNNENKENNERNNEDNQPKKKISFLSRYKRKAPEQKKLLKTLDETELLSRKFEEERKRREEEAQKENERKEQEIAEKSRKFLETLQKEQERRAKMPAQIAEFTKQLDAKMNEIAPQQKPTLVIELLSERQKPVKTKNHESKTFINNINNVLKEKLHSALLQKQQKHKAKALVKIVLFMKFAREKELFTRARLFLIRNGVQIWYDKYKELIKKKERDIQKRNQAFLDRAKKTMSAIRLQRVIRNYLEKQRRIEEERKRQEELERKRQEELELERKRQERERLKVRIPDIQLPDNDDSWLASYKKEIAEDSDFEDFLNSLDTKKPEQKKLSEYIPSSDVDLQSGTTPIQDPNANSIMKKYITKPQQEIEEDEIARVRAEIEAKVRKARANAQKEAAAQQKKTHDSKKDGKTHDSPTKGTISLSPRHSTNKKPGEAESPRSPRQGQNKVEESYALSKETQDLMRMAQNIHKKGPNYQNEAPLERYNRLYGSGSFGKQPPKQGDKIPQRPAIIPLRQNNTRTRRLQKLQKAWFEGDKQEQLERRRANEDDQD